MKKKRLFDKDVEIAKLNSDVGIYHATFLSLFTIGIAAMATLLSLEVQFGLKFHENGDQTTAWSAILILACLLGVGGFIAFVLGRYEKFLKGRSTDLDNIPNAEAAHAKWILYPDASKEEYNYVTAKGRIIEGFDEQGKPVFKKT